MQIVRCADLGSIRDGRNVEVAGVVLVRQRSGSAKGVMFVTIEDETGIANGILWPDKFEICRRQIMSASMIAMRGRLHKKGRSSISSATASPISTICCARSHGWISRWRPIPSMARGAAGPIRAVLAGHRADGPWRRRRSEPGKMNCCVSAAMISIEGGAARRRRADCARHLVGARWRRQVPPGPAPMWAALRTWLGPGGRAAAGPQARAHAALSAASPGARRSGPSGR